MIVADNSVATKWVFREELSDLADLLLAEQIAAAALIAVPRLLPFEFTNVALKRVRRNGLALDDALMAVDTLWSFPSEIHPRTTQEHERIHHRALEFAAIYGLSAACDAHYVALAESIDCDLWTADRRLLREVGSQFPRVRSLDSFVPAQ